MEIKKTTILLFITILMMILSACNNNTELEATIEQQNEHIVELKQQFEEQAELIYSFVDDILELERQLEFWQHISMEDINSDFLSYITIDEGYALIEYFHQSGEQLDFHLYRLRWYLGLEARPDEMPWEQVEIVVVKDDEVVGTISSDNWPSLFGEHRRLILEFPIPFEGYNGFLIPRVSLGMWDFYKLYFVQNGELVYIPEFARISNPSFDFTTGEVTSVSPTDLGFRGSIYHLIDGEFVEVERLDLIGDEPKPIAQVFVDGEWIDQEYDEARWDIYFRGHWSNPGLFLVDGNILIYDFEIEEWVSLCDLPEDRMHIGVHMGVHIAHGLMLCE